jgi:hypothetical protein
MQTLFNNSSEGSRAEEAPNATTLRVIAWLLFAILAIGGTYLYFSSRQTEQSIEVRSIIETNPKIQQVTSSH